MSNTICKNSEPTANVTVRIARPARRPGACTIILTLALGVAFASLADGLWSDLSLESRAARGDAAAEYSLGKRFFDHATSPQDHTRAACWIRKSADQGYAKAQTGLGLMYENGLGVTRNYDEALKWLRRAADQGFAVAQNELGVMYARGRGVPRDLNEASKWCEQAAAQGSAIAKRNLELAEAGKANTLPLLTTRTKSSYQHVTLQKIESDGVTLAFQPVGGGLGFARVRLENLPGDLQHLCRYAARAKTNSNSDSPYTQLDSVSSAL